VEDFVTWEQFFEVIAREAEEYTVHRSWHTRFIGRLRERVLRDAENNAPV